MRPLTPADFARRAARAVLRSGLPAAWVLAACVTMRAQDDGPQANPGRPTVTSPAALPPVGYLQCEQGYLGSLTSPATSAEYGLNQATKLAVLPRLMVEAVWQPYGATRAPGDTHFANGAGDVDAGGQVVLWAAPAAAQTDTAKTPGGQAPSKPFVATVSVAYLGRVHSGTTGDTDLGSFSNSVLLLVGGDWRGWHYDTNVMLNAQSDGAVRRAQTGETLSVTHAVPRHDNITVQAELYHFTQPLVSVDDLQRPVSRAHAVDALFAGTYAPRGNLVFDAGFSHGFTSTSTRWQSFAGFTYLLPHRLWPQKKQKN